MVNKTIHEQTINKPNSLYVDSAILIEATLESHNIRVRVVDIIENNDKSAEYQMEVAVGTRIAEIESLLREIALAVASSSGAVTLRAPIPGRSLIGITVPFRETTHYPYNRPPALKLEDKIKRGVANISYFSSSLFLKLAERMDKVGTRYSTLDDLLENKDNDQESKIFPTTPDPLLPQAIRLIEGYDYASASLFQRRLKVGYARAAKILDELEAAGYVGEACGSKPRNVLSKTNKSTDMKILVSYSDPPVKDALVKMLKSKGYYVYSAKDGEDVLEQLKTDTYDLSIIDWVLPKMMGRDIFSNFDIRKLKGKVAMLTSISDDKFIEEALQYGVCDYFVSSCYTLELLVERLNTILGVGSDKANK